MKRSNRWIVLLLAVASAGSAGADNALIEAVKKGDTGSVRALLEQGADINRPEVDGTTALHWAAHRDDVETAQLLVRAGANANAANRYAVTPLSLACINGTAAMIETLLKAGANPNAEVRDGETALLTAARTGNAAALKVLLAHGADITARESWRGQDALMWAAAEGHIAATRVLIEHGADVNSRSMKAYTPLLFATRAGHTDLVKLLLASGAHVNDTQAEGASALIIAIHNAQFELAAFLLANGADPNINASGYTPLHLAIQMGHLDEEGIATPVPTGKLGYRDLIKTLLAQGADPNARMTKRFIRLPNPPQLSLVGATPFLLAAKAVDVPLMRLFLESGADPRQPTAANATPLMAAAGIGYVQGNTPGTEAEALEAVKLTLELGGDVNAATNTGLTAMHGAAIRGANSIVTFLVEKGARVDVKDKQGETPLALIESPYSIKKQPHTATLLRKLMADAR